MSAIELPPVSTIVYKAPYSFEGATARRIVEQLDHLCHSIHFNQEKAYFDIECSTNLHDDVWKALDDLVSSLIIAEIDTYYGDSEGPDSSGIARIPGTRVQDPDEEFDYDDLEYSEYDRDDFYANEEYHNPQPDELYDEANEAKSVEPKDLPELVWRSRFAESKLLTRSRSLGEVRDIISRYHAQGSAQAAVNTSINEIVLRGRDINVLEELRSRFDQIEARHRTAKRVVAHLIDVEERDDLLKFVVLENAPLRMCATTVLRISGVTSDQVMRSWTLRLLVKDGNTFVDVAKDKEVIAVPSSQISTAFSPLKNYRYPALTPTVDPNALVSKDQHQTPMMEQVSTWAQDVVAGYPEQGLAHISSTTATGEPPGPEFEYSKSLHLLDRPDFYQPSQIVSAVGSEPSNNVIPNVPNPTFDQVPLIPTERRPESQADSTRTSETVSNVGNPAQILISFDGASDVAKQDCHLLLESQQGQSEVLSREMHHTINKKRPANAKDTSAEWAEGIERLQSICCSMFEDVLAFRGKLSIKYELGRIIHSDRPKAGIDSHLSKPSIQQALQSSRRVLFANTVTTSHADADQLLAMKWPGGLRMFEAEPQTIQLTYLFAAYREDPRTKTCQMVIWEMDGDTFAIKIRQIGNSVYVEPFGSVYCNFPCRAWDAVLRLEGHRCTSNVEDEDVRRLTDCMSIEPGLLFPRIYLRSPRPELRIVEARIYRTTTHLHRNTAFALEVTEVQNLAVMNKIAPPTLTVLEGYEYPRAVAEGRLWYEFNLLPLQVKKTFVENETLDLHALASWNPSTLFNEAQMEELHWIVREVVTRMDSIGSQNSGVGVVHQSPQIEPRAMRRQDPETRNARLRKPQGWDAPQHGAGYWY